MVYETHATTTDHEAVHRHRPVPGRLWEVGCRQACELGERRPGHGFAGVFVSDLHRAVQTARIGFPDCQLPIHQDVRLRECDYGDVSGDPLSFIGARRAQRIDGPFPGGRSYHRVAVTTRPLLRAPLPPCPPGARAGTTRCLPAGPPRSVEPIGDSP
ncbi:histidine phosphatase family protein [Streptomyces sp. NBC_01724]